MSKGFKDKEQRTIQVYMEEMPQRYIKQVYKKMTKRGLSEAQMKELSAEIGMDIVFAYLKDKIKEGETVNAIVRMSRGEQPFFNVIATKQNNELAIEMESLNEQLGLEGKEKEEALEFAKGFKVLKEDEWFMHPLADCNDKSMNLYMLASFLINVIRQVPRPDTNDYGDPKSSEETLSHLIFRANPSANINRLIAEIKQHSYPTIMKICNMVANIEG